MKNLRSKVAVVTGAGSGIGREISLALAKDGCHLALCDVLPGGLEETRDLLKPMGVNVSLHEVDVSDKDRMKTFSEEVIEEHQHVNILINNAGIASGVTFEDQSLKDFHKVMNINLYGVIYGCKYFLPLLKKEKESHVVNICSIIGLCGNPMLVSYCTSKFAVRGFSESLYLELKAMNIPVTTVYPGWTKTNIIDSANISDKVENLKTYQTFKENFFNKGNSPAIVAKRTIQGIKKNRREVITGVDALLMGLAKKFFPNLALRIVSREYES